MKNLLVVPPGSAVELFPWGVEFLKEHMDHVASSSTEIVDLRADPEISAVFEECGEDLAPALWPPIAPLFFSLDLAFQTGEAIQ